MRIFRIPFFDFDEYIKIKESNISILSDYCFAGYLYHKFGLQFTSPTINMYADNENYYKFLLDIEGHMKLPMQEVENTRDNLYKGIYAYPRGYVGNSEWVFNHDVTFDKAVARWNKGVARFNYDNFIVIMTIYSEEMAYLFDKLPIENKIGFYWKELNLNSVICMPEWNNPKVRERYNSDFSALINRVADEENGIRAINWIKALQHKGGFNRIE